MRKGRVKLEKGGNVPTVRVTFLLLAILLLSGLAGCDTISTESATQTPNLELTENPMQDPSDTDEPETPSDIVEVDLDAIPPVDISQHSVPIGEIYFDTFSPVNRAVSLNDATPELIRRLRDVIPPIYNPVFESAESAGEWLSGNDLVIGYADGNEAYSYPLRIMTFHELVSHEVNGRAVLSSYCPLCRSGVVYDRTINGETYLFGNTSALYESDLVMLDHATGSYWVQVTGEAVIGPLTGTKLTLLPSQTTTWKLWLEQYPQTVSLSRDTGHQRDYGRDFLTAYLNNLENKGEFIFPVSEAGRDPRLNPAEIVLGVQINGVTAVYPIKQIGDGVVNDVLNGVPIVVFSSSEGPTGVAYSPMVDGEVLTFEWDNGIMRDEQTGSIWNFAGRSIDGPLKGNTITPLPVRSTLWFVLIASYPDLLIRQP